MSEVESLVRASLHRSNPWADPLLAQELAEHEHRRLGYRTDARGYYSSSTFLPEEVDDVAFGALRCADARTSIEVHGFEPGLPRRYRDLGMEPSVLDPAVVLDRLSNAIEFTAHVQEARRSIEALVRVVHPLEPADPDYDVSYSDPSLPFSIFIAIPRASVADAIPRIAEGILHEAMHLQLSLIEKHVELVRGGESSLYSPWRDSDRPTAGVLHGLYVFRAVREFMRRLAADARLTEEERSFCARRAEAIVTDIDAVAALRDHPSLTGEGKALASSLLDGAIRPQPT